MHDELRPAPPDEAVRPVSDRGERPPDLSILARVESELTQVQQALGRLDEGSYGTCRVCAGLVGDDRLEAEPATALCAQHAAG